MLFTPEGVRKLKDKKVTVFGVGGVGGYVCEMLGRSGIGHFVLVDKDQVDVTNINRQIIALSSTVGKDKVEVMKERLIEINPECEVTSVKAFHLPVLYSEEEPVKPAFTPEDSHKGSSTPASSPFVPSAAGILIASYVVARLLEQ